MSQPRHNPLDRRRFLGLIGAAGAGMVATACAGPGSSSSGKSSTAPAVEGAVEGDVSFAHWRAEDQKVFDKILKKFTAEYPDVSIQQDISAAEDYQSSALQRIKSGNVGDTFVAFRGAQFEDMTKAGIYAELTNDDLVSAFAPDAAKLGQRDGKQYGLPYQSVFLMPVYNIDLFDKHGVSEVPTDWDGFLSMCDTFKSAGITPIAWPGGEPGNAAQLMNSMIMNNAPSPDMCTKIEQGEYRCTDDWFLKSLEQYAELVPYMQDNASGTQPEPLEQMFASQKAAMLATGSYHIIAVRSLGAKFPMDVLSPITTSASEAKYEGVHNHTFLLGVNSASDNGEAASAFLEFLAKPEIASEYANGTRQHVPVTAVEYTDPDLARLEPWLDRETILAPRYQFLDLDVATAVQGSCIEVVAGSSPEQAAEKAQGIVDQQIK
ncbi:extracellular solute-binding protein [Nocardioidaceae bacterium SCSIO 66511]|nr:extracellular solute-binding protein [Nocardioidaceae bacterium SCSIO 66511]